MRIQPGFIGGLVVVCVSALLAGCSTFGEKPSRGGDRSLTTCEEDLAKALAHYSQGLIYEFELGLGSQEALDQFKQASGFDSTNHLLASKVATVGLYQLKFDEAIPALEALTRQRPLSAEAWINLAAAQKTAGHTDSAIANYRRGVRLSPTNTSVYIQLASLYFQKNDDRAAIKAARAGLHEATQPQAILYYLHTTGREFVAANQFKRAIPCFEIISKNDLPHMGLIYMVLGELHEETGNRAEATRYYRLALSAEEPDAYLKLALLDMPDNPAAARAVLVEAEQRLTNNPSLLFGIALTHVAQTNYEEALPYFEKAAAGQLPDEEKLAVGFYMTYADTCEKVGRSEEATRVLLGCIALYPDADEPMNYLAYLWAEKGIRLNEALEYVRQALRARPDNGSYIDTLGWVYFKQQKYALALEQLLKADALDPDDPTINDHIGEAFQAIGKKEEAVKYWSRSLKRAPADESVATKLRAAGADVEAIRRQAHHEGD